MTGFPHVGHMLCRQLQPGPSPLPPAYREQLTMSTTELLDTPPSLSLSLPHPHLAENVSAPARPVLLGIPEERENPASHWPNPRSDLTSLAALIGGSM